MLFVPLGGMLFTLACAFMSSTIVEWFEGARMITTHNGIPIVVSISLIFVVSMAILHWQNQVVERRSKINQSAEAKKGLWLIIGLVVLVMIVFLSADIPTSAFVFSIVTSGAVAYAILFALAFPQAIRWIILSLWVVMLLATFVFGSWVHAVSAPVFVSSWLLVGGAIGMMLSRSGALYAYVDSPPRNSDSRKQGAVRRKSTTPRGISTGGTSMPGGPRLTPRAPQMRSGRRLSRAARTSGERSAFGRVPIDTVKLLSSHIRDVSGPILSYLPLGITRSMRDWTIKQTLETVLRDWRENENLDELSKEDIADLGSFAELAYELAVGKSLEALSPVEDAVFKAILSALLNDWLANWNADGVDGPPRR